MSPNSLRSDCRKFAPNIFNKTKCSNCFKQKEEHTAEALECNRAMRKVAKCGYLFVAPGWDFSIPLNRTKRWQRRWFVLYDDGELNYSVDEHPDTVPQASIDMTQVLEVAGAEEVTGHAFSLAITAPDRVTFVKAMARDEARAWTSVLAVYTRNKGRHKRNATFPGGQTTTIHQTQAQPRSGTPNPIRPRYNSCHSDSSLRPGTRWNQDTTPSPASIITPTPSASISKSSSSSSCRSTGYRDQPPSSASPPTRDKLNSEEKAAVRRTRQQQNIPNLISTPPPASSDCPDGPLKSNIPDYETSSKRLETLHHIAAVLTRPRVTPPPAHPPPTRDSDTDTAPGPSAIVPALERVELPAETLLHLKKGWLMLQQQQSDWSKLWFVLCGANLTAYKDPKFEDQRDHAIITVILSQVACVSEVQVQRNYGFQIRLWNDNVHTLSAVTAGIRSNWLCSIRRAAGLDDLPPRPVTSNNSTNSSNTLAPGPATSVTHTAARLPLLSSDEEYRTASEGGRRESGEWIPASPPLTRTPISRVKERARSRSNRSSPSSRASTLDSVSTDELLAADELQRLHATLQRTENDKLTCLNQLKEKDDILNETLVKYEVLNKDYQSKHQANLSLQEELNCVNERLQQGVEENDYLYKKLQELEDKGLHQHNSFGSLSDLTNVELDLDFNTITKDTLMDEYNNLRLRFEKAVQEIRAMKRELRNSNLKYDDLELNNITLKQDLKQLEEDNQAQNTMMAARIQDLTTKLTASEKQVRNLKSKLQDSREKRRSLSLKGKESFSINKEVEDKITELEVKILSLETNNKRVIKPTKKVTKRDRSSDRSSPVDERTQRRLRRKSLDSATTSEPMKVLIRLSSLESKVTSICDTKPVVKDENLATSTESLNISNQESKSESNSRILALESTIEAAKMKLSECIEQFQVLKHARRPEDILATLEQTLNEVTNILKSCNSVSPAEVNVINDSVLNIVQSFEKLLSNKLTELAKTRRTLRDSGTLTPQNSMNILAEKLAYESVLISRIHEALNAVHNDNTRFSSRILQRGILETGQLIQQLQAKLSGTIKPPTARFNEEHLTRILTRHLIHVNYITNSKQVSEQQHHHQDVSKGLEYLLTKQTDVNNELQKYKAGKLEQLAYRLAVETLNYASDTDCRLDKQGLEDMHVQEAWQLAQERVSSELVQAEISHVLTRVAQSYIPDSSDTFFTLWAAERAALELWGDVVEERLQEELNRTTAEIRTAVDTALSKLRPATPWRRRLELERRSYLSHTSNTARGLLAEFADIVAHKALIDARIAVFKEEIIKPPKSEEKIDSSLVRNLIDSENHLLLFEESNIINGTQLVEAEFQTVYLKCLQAALAETQTSPVDIKVVEALKGIDEVVSRLQGVLPTEGIKMQSWKDVVERCSELQQRLANVSVTTRACSQCQHLKDSIHRLSREHSAELAVHESSQAQLRERARQLEHRLGTLDSEYAKQLEQLRAAYRDTLTTPPVTPGLGSDVTDTLRARYQAEIEQLRALCEKGLAAVESTHRRVVAELQDKHRREREQLLEEKEQALAEETQATLAALDAMRKAHEHEVRREVGKFKADFLRKLQATHDLGALHQEHEAEMREIKAEILALSERYSVKCVESASLEEQLCSVHQQLAHAHKHIQQLDKRNKQLAEAVATAAVATAASTDDTYHLHRIRNPQLSSLQN